MTEQQSYEAADKAIAAADAVTFSRVGKIQTDAMYVSQWGADAEAADACLKASKIGPAYWRAQYLALAEQYAAYVA